MSLGTITRHPRAVLAALALLLACGSAAEAQVMKTCTHYCSPCSHPYFGNYPTCWRPWPAGWNCWNCGLAMMPAPHVPSPIEQLPTPGIKNGEMPEPIPAPRPDPIPQSQGQLRRFLTYLIN